VFDDGADCLMTQRLKFTIAIAVIASAVGVLVYTAVDQTKMYMLTVGEFLGSGTAYSGTTVRIAGRVRPGSMRWEADTRDLYFTLDDIAATGTLAVHYNGILPDMFSEGRDVIVEGPSTGGETFVATTVLTSCPSKYKPE
jgi:cytochrome c-type biogenesis protein CcmE